MSTPTSSKSSAATGAPSSDKTPLSAPSSDGRPSNVHSGDTLPSDKDASTNKSASAKGTSPTRLSWQDFFVVESAGVRTTLAALLPLIVGQLTGNTALGALVGMGGLQAAFLDFEGSTWRTLLVGALASAAMALMGGVASQSAAPLAVLLIFVVAFGMGMLAAYGEVWGNMGFVLSITYAFAQVHPVPWSQALTYAVTFGVGGLLSTLMTLLLWRLRRHFGDRKAGQAVVPTREAELPAEATAPVEVATAAQAALEAGDRSAPLRTHLNLHSSVFQHAVRTATATALAVAVCRLFDPSHGFWLVLTILVILKPDYHATRQRVMERVGGSILGGLAALVPLAYLHNVVALDIALLLFGVMAFSQLPRNYGLYVVFLTPFVVLLTNMSTAPDPRVAYARIYETLVGAGLAFAVAFLLRSPRCWPRRFLLGRPSNQSARV